jgi:hypothetical protein
MYSKQVAIGLVTCGRHTPQMHNCVRHSVNYKDYLLACARWQLMEASIWRSICKNGAPIRLPLT